jgi:hypothetical protein
MFARLKLPSKPLAHFKKAIVVKAMPTVNPKRPAMTGCIDPPL